MGRPTWGSCEECGEVASIGKLNDRWLCPSCRFEIRHDE